LEEVDQQPESNIDVETGEYYQSLEEMQALAKILECDTLINCTGMGSKALVKDPNMVGARGVLLQLDRNNCPRREALEGMTKDAIIIADSPPWGSDTEPAYMIPRGDIIAVGGTYLEGDAHPYLRDSERTRLLNNAQLLGVDVANAPVVGEWTGFRPSRPTVRCEEEKSSTGVRTIHNYGHGGSGWTVNVGAAKEVANILLGSKR